MKKYRPHISKEDKAKLIADLPYYGNTDLAHKYGISAYVVSWHRSKAGIPCPRNYISPENRSKVIRLRTAGKTIDQIIAETGLTEYSVKKILHDAGGFGILDPKRYSETHITPENCEPACYDGLPKPSFDWDSIVTRENPNYGQECRKRYEELRKWKSAKAKELSRKGKAIYDAKEKNSGSDSRGI